jgi:hypothetical protein
MASPSSCSSSTFFVQQQQQQKQVVSETRHWSTVPLLIIYHQKEQQEEKMSESRQSSSSSSCDAEDEEYFFEEQDRRYGRSLMIATNIKYNNKVRRGRHTVGRRVKARCGSFYRNKLRCYGNSSKTIHGRPWLARRQSARDAREEDFTYRRQAYRYARRPNCGLRPPRPKTSAPRAAMRRR